MAVGAAEGLKVEAEPPHNKAEAEPPHSCVTSILVHSAKAHLPEAILLRPVVRIKRKDAKAQRTQRGSQPFNHPKN